MSHDLGTLQEEQPGGLLLVCEILPFFLGFSIEKVLSCKYLDLLLDISKIWRLMQQCTRAVKVPACIS